jgi:hypothetical protein
LYVFRTAPREADVENVRSGEDWDVDGRFVDVDVRSLGRESASGLEECNERREKEVERVEKVDDCGARLGMRRSDLEDC